MQNVYLYIHIFIFALLGIIRNRKYFKIQRFSTPLQDAQFFRKSKIVKIPLSSELETWDDHGPILCWRSEPRVSLNYKINCQAQLRQALVSAMHACCVLSSCNDFGIVRNKSNVVPPTHKLLHLSRTTVRVCLKYLHHVLFRVRNRVSRLLTVCWNIEWLVIVQHLQNVGWRGRGDNGGRDDLIHRLVITWMAWVMNKTSTAAINIYRAVSKDLSIAVDGSCLPPDKNVIRIPFW